MASSSSMLMMGTGSNVPGSGTPGGGDFLPTDESGLVIWYEPVLTEALYDNNDLVTVWTDSSPAVNDATAAVELNAPIWKSNQQNGLGAVLFAQGNQTYFTLPNSFSALTQGEIFVVIKCELNPAADDANSGIWKFGTAAAADHYPYTSLSNVYMGWGSLVRRGPIVIAGTMTQFHILNVQVDPGSGNYIVRVNNNNQPFTANPSFPAFTTSPWLGRSVGDVYFNGYMGEVIMYDHALTPAIRNAVYLYLRNKWAIVAVPPAPFMPDQGGGLGGGGVVRDAATNLTLNTNGSVETTWTLEWTDAANEEDQFKVYSSENEGAWSLVVSADEGVETWNSLSVEGPLGIYDSTLLHRRWFVVPWSTDYDGFFGIPTNIAYGIPATPTGLASDYESGTSATITWVYPAKSYVKSYEIERRVNAGAITDVATVVTDGDPTEPLEVVDDLTGLDNGDIVEYRVRALSIDEEYVGLFSAWGVSLEVLSDPPLAPSNLALSGDFLSLSWEDNSDNETGFEIYFNFERAAFTEVVAGSPTAADVETIPDVSALGTSPDIGFAYRVRAINGAGNSAFIDHVPNRPHSLVNQGAEAPDFYTDNRPVDWTLGGGNPDISTGVEVWRKVGAGSYALWNTLAANETSFIDTDDLSADIGETVYYKVRETNSVGTSAFSDEISGTLVAP